LSHINVGTGVECTIRDLAETVAEVTSYEGKISFDTSKPDGAPRKLLDTAKVSALGWRAKIPLREGLEEVYRYYKGTDAKDIRGV
jgi:GDP-L-fucose synthase